MAYDETSATDRAKLRAEVVGNQGYYGDPAAYKTVSRKLGDKDISRTVDPGETSEGLTGTKLGAASTLDGAEYAAAVDTTAKQVWVDMLVGFGESVIPFEHHDRLLDPTTGIFNDTNAPTIRAGLLRRQCECEFMFGNGPLPTQDQYFVAIGPADSPVMMNAAQQQTYVNNCVENKVMSSADAAAKAPTKQAPGYFPVWS